MILIKNRSLRNTVRVAVPFIVIPSVVLAGALIFDQKKHIVISLGVAFFSLLLFAAGYEKKNTGTRRMVLTAVMTALCLAGRLIPFLKPVSALTIITGMWLGGEAGFLTGALSALISNFYFGQGPWTSFQMVAIGLQGLFAGILSKQLQKNRILLIIYGFAAGIAYSFTMDIWTVLWYNSGFSLKLYAAALITAVPYTLSYSIANILYLWFLSPAFSEKLSRIKKKYGI